MTEIPDSVTHREVQEILRTFTASGWTGMRLEVRGMTITVGKHGPPAAGAAAAPAAAAPPELQQSHFDARNLHESGFAATNAAPSAAPAPPPAPPPAPVPTEGLVEVRSPAVGAFWVAPSPGEPPFVEVGQVVGVNEQLAIVEVMKLMNPVVAPEAGEVVEVCATNAAMVEYEQVLFRIRPADG